MPGHAPSKRKTTRPSDKLPDFAAAAVARDVGRQDSYQMALCAMLAAVFIGRACEYGNGMYAEPAMPYLLGAFILVVIALWAPTWQTLEAKARTVAQPLAVGAIAWQVSQLLTFREPAKYLHMTLPGQSLYFAFYLAFLAVIASQLAQSRRLISPVYVSAFLLVFALWGHWLLGASPDPDMDVVITANQSLKALVGGHNPYDMTFDYPAANPASYGPNMVKDGHLMFGFAYPPITLLLNLPGYIVGDYRYSLLAALIVVAFVMDRLSDETVVWAPAALLLLTPRILFQLEEGWSEPYLLVFIALTALLERHRPRWVPFILGLLLSSKQYVFLFIASAAVLPSMNALTPEGQKRWLKVAATAAAITLPFFLWSPKAFYHSLIETQIGLPYRSDALNFSAWYLRASGTQLSATWGFVAGVAALAMGLWRAPRSPSGFCLVFGVAVMFFLSLNRQAFNNYYFLCQGCLLLASAAIRPNVSTAEN